MQVQFLRTDINCSIATINKNRGRNAPILVYLSKGHKGDGSICALKNIFKIAENKKRAQIEPSPLCPKKQNRVPGKGTRFYRLNERFIRNPDDQTEGRYKDAAGCSSAGLAG